MGQHSFAVHAFVARHPDENHERVYRWLLERNLRLFGVAFAVDSPLATRHSHSRRIDVPKPSSRIVLNDSSAYDSTAPSSRSISSGDTDDSGNRPSR